MGPSHSGVQRWKKIYKHFANVGSGGKFEILILFAYHIVKIPTPINSGKICPYVLLLVLHNHLWRPKKGVKFRGINSCVDKLALSYFASTICCRCNLSPLLGCQTATFLEGGPNLRSNGNQCSGFLPSAKP